MQYSEGSLGRVFVIRTEDGEDLIESIQNFVTEKKVRSGVAIFLGALREGRLITGPKEPTIPPGAPFVEEIKGAWEVLGVATIYPGGRRDGTRNVASNGVRDVASGGVSDEVSDGVSPVVGAEGGNDAGSKVGSKVGLARVGEGGSEVDDEAGLAVSAEAEDEAGSEDEADGKVGDATCKEVIEDGPKIHIHTTAGWDERTVTGCLREKATTYLIAEVILIELLGLDARRELDEISGLYLLSLGTRFP